MNPRELFSKWLPTDLNGCVLHITAKDAKPAKDGNVYYLIERSSRLDLKVRRVIIRLVTGFVDKAIKVMKVWW